MEKEEERCIDVVCVSVIAGAEEIWFVWVDDFVIICILGSFKMALGKNELKKLWNSDSIMFVGYAKLRKKNE